MRRRFTRRERISAIETSPQYSVEVTLRDGAKRVIRAIRPDDKPLLLEHFNALSDESRYFRFMGARRDLKEDELRQFTELDFRDRVGLAATETRHGVERFIGVGRYVREDDAPRAEVAFAVLDEFHGHGIGTLLLHHLAIFARRAGIREFDASVMGANRKMIEVFENSGFKIHEKNLDGTVVVSMLIAES